VYVGVVGGEERPLAALAGGRAEAVLTRVQLVDVVVSERLAALKTPPPPLIRTCTPHDTDQPAVCYAVFTLYSRLYNLLYRYNVLYKRLDELCK